MYLKIFYCTDAWLMRLIRALDDNSLKTSFRNCPTEAAELIYRVNKNILASQSISNPTIKLQHENIGNWKRDKAKYSFESFLSTFDFICEFLFCSRPVMLDKHLYIEAFALCLFDDDGSNPFFIEQTVRVVCLCIQYKLNSSQ